MAESTMTLVMTDVEGSTRLWSDRTDVMLAAMARHHEIVHGAIAAHGGWRPVDQGEGDAVFAAFESAPAAVAAVAEFQSALAAEAWPEGVVLRDRVGVHVGAVLQRGGNLFGPVVNRTARLRGLGSGGQVLLSGAAYEIVRDELPAGLAVVDLGEHRMKDLRRPEHVYQLTVPEAGTVFPPLASLDRAATNLPLQTTPFVGREREIAEIADLVRTERMVTIVGFGGMGKTRLALQVGAELADGDGDGVWFVDLSALTLAEQVPTAIAAVLDLTRGGMEPMAALRSWLPGRRLLLVLDNLEQLLPGAAGVIAELLALAPGLRVLATSRERVRIRLERAVEVGPMPLPPVRAGARWDESDLEQFTTYAAVALFLTRAASARPDFSLTPDNAAAVAAICARLDGLPLALELAAARLRLLSPAALLPRLERGLATLSGGDRDLPARQQTIRATIAWSVDALGLDEQAVLAGLSVFPGSFTFDAADEVAGDGGDVLEALGVLVDRSLVRRLAGDGDDRFVLLVPIREYAGEHAAALGGTRALRRRHTEYYAHLASLGADWTRAQRARQVEAVRADWHNVRHAVTDLHDSADIDGEIALAADVARPLSQGGRAAEARAVVDHALAHLTAEPAPAGVRLMVAKEQIEYAAGRNDIARPWVLRALDDARVIGEPSLLSLTLTNAAPHLATGGELIDESDRLLQRMGETGNEIPKWYCAERWLLVASDLPSVEWERLDAAWRRRLALAPDSERLRERFNFGSTLLDRGLVTEALEFLGQHEDVRPADTSVALVPMLGAYYAGVCRLALGELARAGADFDLAEARLETMDVPDIAAEVSCRRAALERLQGRPDDAIRRVRGVAAQAELDSVVRATAAWLGAVIEREAGHRDAARASLRDAWQWLGSSESSFTAGVRRQLLLEHATQEIDGDPVATVRSVAWERVRTAGGAFHYGVEYEPDRLLERARAALGAPQVDAVADAAADLPLPSTL